MIGTRQRFIMVLGDEGATLCEIRGTKLLASTFARSPSEAERMTAMLAARPKTPIACLVDVLDIALVPETIPPAATRQREQILQRRTRRAFPDFDYTGTMALGRESNGRRDHLYLVAGVAPSPGFDAWMAFVDAVANPRGEMALLPIEALRLMKTLAGPEGKSDELWSILISRERSGGFRQVIARRGVIQFTRLTQTIDASAGPEEVAAAIEIEYGHTMDYVKRLGFAPGDGLGLVVIAADAECRALERRTLAATQKRFLAPRDLAALFGIENAADESEGYCDIIHAAAFAARNRPLLTLRSRVIVERERARRFLVYCYFGAAAIAAAVVLYLIAPVSNIFSLRNDMAELEQRRRGALVDLTALQSELATLPRPLGQMVGELRTWHALRAESTDFSESMARLRATLGTSATVTDVAWSLEFSPRDAGGRARGRATIEQRRYLNLRVTLDLNGVQADRAAAVALGEEIADRIAAAFADYAVSVPRLPVPIRPTETLRIEAGRATDGAVARPVSMVVLIESVEGPAEGDL